MPSKSKKQAKLMAACAHGAKYKADVKTGIQKMKGAGRGR